MITVLTDLPATITAGVTVQYRRTFADYPASVNDLTLHLVGKSVLTYIAGKEGDTFVLTLSSAETAALEAGYYSWAERVTDGTGAIWQVASGRLSVYPDIAAAAPGAFLTWEETAIPIVQSAIAGSLPSGMKSYQIAGRAVERYSMEELWKLLRWLEARVIDHHATTGFGRTVLFQFTDTGYDT